MGRKVEFKKGLDGKIVRVVLNTEKDIDNGTEVIIGRREFPTGRAKKEMLDDLKEELKAHLAKITEAEQNIRTEIKAQEDLIKALPD